MEEARQPENIAQVDIDPNSPLSDFAVALRNIRANLLAGPEITLKLIQQAFLRTILTLTIPVANDLKQFLEFPIAASWRKGHEDVMEVFYSGLGSDSSAEKEELDRTIEEVQRESIKEEKSELRVKKLRGFLRKKKTEYPESLRNIEGCWPLTLKGYEDENELKFLVFYSRHKIDGAEQSSREVNVNKRRVRNAFQKMFFESGYRSIEFLIKAPKHYKELDKNKLGQYSFLKDIISTIQDQITRLRRAPETTQGSSKTKQAQVELERVFGVVFVRPTLVYEKNANDEEETKLFFQYELSHQQIYYLKNQFPEKKNEIIQYREQEILTELKEAYADILKKPQDIQLDDVENDLKQIIKDLVNEGRHKSGKIDEFLRKAIYTYYAFERESKQDFNKKFEDPGLATAIEEGEGYVPGKEAFLITQIFDLRRPDIVSNIVNHPLSKLQQHTTSDLIESFDRSDKQAFYPRFLLLFETLFFPKRMFMYPMYQYDAPVMLCACDADYYAFVRQSLKSILDRYTEGIFTTIIGDKRSEAIGELARVLKDTEDEKESIVAFQRELHRLILLFAEDFRKAISLTAVDPIAIGSGEELVQVAIGESGDYVEVSVDDLSTKFRFEGKEGAFFTRTPSGRHVLELYLEEFVRIFCTIRNNNNLIRENERGRLSSAVAHGVKTSLSPMASLSNLLERRLGDLSKLMNSLSEYKKYPTLPYGMVRLKTDIDVNRINSISNVLSFYSEDAESKISLLYGGFKEGKPSKNTEKAKSLSRSYILAGIVRAYCIAVIRRESNLVPPGEINDVEINSIELEINGEPFSFSVPDLQNMLETVRGYKFPKSNGLEIDISELRFDRVESLEKLEPLTINKVIANDRYMTVWKNRILLIVVEELTLNALKSNGFSGKIAINSDNQYVFRIENESEDLIPDKESLKKEIGVKLMGGLHAAYFLAQDAKYLGLKYDSDNLKIGNKVRNRVWLLE